MSNQHKGYLIPIVFLIFAVGVVGLFLGIKSTKKSPLSRTQISQLYVTLFGRASEGAGNTFWRNSESLPQAATAMLASQAAKEYFGNKLGNNRIFIEIIYQNALNKNSAQDPEGVNFWVTALDKGADRGEVVAALIHAIYQYAGSSNPAAQSAYQRFVNRVEVSDYCAARIEAPQLTEADNKMLKNVISNVTDDLNTVATAKKICDRATTK